jgi:DNA-binding protein HU-beta
VSRAETEKVLGVFFEHAVSATKKGEKVGWPGFGHFSTVKRAARVGQNPRTGEKVKIPASTAMKFTPSSTLKTALNGKKAAPAKKAAAKRAAPAKKAAKKR